MIDDRDLVMVRRVGERVLQYTAGPMTVDEACRYMEWRPSSTFEVDRVPTCRCCGEPAIANLRCRKHLDRNPCAIEGCSRTAAAMGQLATDQVICGAHWRAFVPIGSPERRIYNRFQRRGRRFGWTDESYSAFCRVWDCIVRRARARAAGDIDEAEILRMFGWAEAA